jgi:hypothetical protein
MSRHPSVVRAVRRFASGTSQQDIEVALYVHTLVEAERRGATAALRTLLRQQMDALGLTQPGMRVLRWRIGQPQTAATRPDDPERESAKQRFTVVDGREGQPHGR